MSMSDGYPFVFVFKDNEGSYRDSQYTYQYRFKSERSHHTYIVRAECFPKHSYCLKFYDKANRSSDNKFSLLTNTFEPRTIFYTLYHILLDVLRRDPDASFFFIGAADGKDEMGEATRRFRVYRKFTSSVVSDGIFEHYRVNELSLYILVNKRSVEDTQLYAKLVADAVRSALAEDS